MSVVREGLLGEVTFKQRPDWYDRMKGSLGKAVAGREAMGQSLLGVSEGQQEGQGARR